MPSNEWLTITVGAVLVNNIVLSRIMGICPFLGVSKKIKTALGMGGAVIFVMGLASLATSCLYHGLLSVKLNFQIGSLKVENLDLSFTRILVFIVVAVISLIVYNVLPSIKNEEDFQ